MTEESSWLSLRGELTADLLCGQHGQRCSRGRGGVRTTSFRPHALSGDIEPRFPNTRIPLSVTGPEYMAIDTITFDPNAGTIRAQVAFRSPQVVSYGLLLWEAGSNTIIMEEKGNSANPEDDVYSLPMPAGANDGRILE